MAISTKELLEAAEKLDGEELEEVIDQLLIMRAQRKVPHLSQRETELFTVINKGLPGDVHQRYMELIRKRKDETLTEDEYVELLQLTDQSELLQAERLEALVKLAQIRGTTLRELMNDLGIKGATME